MRILACADIHGNHETYRWLVGIAADRKVDCLVLAGDLLGVPDGFETVEEAQREEGRRILGLLRPLPVPVFFVMGNDDLVELEAAESRVRSLHSRRIDFRGHNFVGYPYTLPFMGGSFEKPEVEIEADLAEIEPLLDSNTLLVTHVPARGILDSSFLGTPAGSESVRRLIERCDVRLHIHGHVHGRFGRDGRHFNVAAGRMRRAMVIDVEPMRHDIVEVPGPAW